MLIKKWKKIITCTMMLCLCMIFTMTSSASTKYESVSYGKVTKISVKKNAILPGEKTKIKVKKKADKKEVKFRWNSITYKSLTPSIASVSKNGQVKGKKAGTAKIKVIARYTVKERVYAKCGRRIQGWALRKCKETKILKIKVLKKEPVHVVISDPVPVVGGSMTLYFQCDGQAYGSPIMVGVGINPDTDYKVCFPADPEKEGQVFDGWYSKEGIKIGWKARDIYPAFHQIVSGSTATVFAKFYPASTK